MRKLTVFFAVMLTAAVCFSEKIKEDFEKADLKKWEVDSEVKIATDQFHAGKKSLSVPLGNSAVWVLGKENKFGTVTVWVYDSKIGKIEDEASLIGPHFGLKNSDDEMLKIGLRNEASGLKWGAYYWCSTLKNKTSWWPVFSKKLFPAAGWYKFTITYMDKTNVEVTFNDEKTIPLPEDKTAFDTGFNAIFFNGGKNGNETFYFDDIEIALK